MANLIEAQAEGSSSTGNGNAATPAEHSTAQVNFLSTAHTLLLSSLPPASHSNHPYAPASRYGSWKGKAREGSQGVGIEEQERMLRMMKEGVAAARLALGEAIKGDKSTKLARAMKEVVTHQSASLPLIPYLTPDSSRPPSFSISLAPIQLLDSISQRLGIETYLEESQFGLLKTTLAIAGKRFVLDVDLEVDSATGAEGEDDDPPATGSTSMAQNTATTGDTRRGRVRLTKLIVNHVTKDEATARSDSVGMALQRIIEEYVEYWNSDRQSQNQGHEKEGERLVKALWDEMSDLAGLDRMAEGSGRDLFTELEEVAGLVKGLVDEGVIYHVRQAVLPTFTLLSGDTRSVFHLRPAAVHENVMDPLNPLQGRCDWIMEYIPDILPGMVVRRNWLQTELQDGVGGDRNEARVEQLLYGGRSQGGTFPYAATFLHCRANSGAGGNGKLEQQWSMVSSGPAGYLIGRCGVSKTPESIRAVSSVLARQARFNAMIARILGSHVVSTLEEDNDSEGIDEDADFDMLTSPPTSLPITLKLESKAVVASMPLPHSEATPPPTLTLSFSPSESGSTLEIQWTVSPGADESTRTRLDQAIERARTVELDVVQAVTIIEQALKPCP